MSQGHHENSALDCVFIAISSHNPKWPVFYLNRIGPMSCEFFRKHPQLNKTKSPKSPGQFFVRVGSLPGGGHIYCMVWFVITSMMVRDWSQRFATDSWRIFTVPNRFLTWRALTVHISLQFTTDTDSHRLSGSISTVCDRFSSDLFGSCLILLDLEGS